MDQSQYLLLMGACVLITLPLEFLLGARVYRSPKRLLTAMLPTVIIFTLWDVLGIVRQHWTYNGDFVTGIDLGVLPLEELVFFIVIPICGLLTYEAVGKVLALLRGTGPVRYTWSEGLVRAPKKVDGHA